MDKSKSRNKSILALRLIVSFGILGYLINLLDWQHLGNVVSQARLEYVWIAPILLLAGLYCLGLRWVFLLKHFGIQLAPKDSFIYYLVSNFYNIILPGAISGDIIRVGICAFKKKQPVVAIATTALLERVFGLLVVLFIGSVSILLLPDNLRSQIGTTLLQTTLSIFTGTLFGVMIVWFLMGIFPVRWLEARTKKIRILSMPIQMLQKLRQIPLTACLIIFSINALSPIFDILASYCMSKAISLNLPLIVLFVVIPIVYITTVIPISLGGLGVREGVLTLLLARVGIQASDAVTFSLAIYLNRVIVALIGGLFQVFWHLPTRTEKIIKNKQQE